VLALLYLSAAGPVLASENPSATTVTEVIRSFHSQALGRETSYTIVLPKNPSLPPPDRGYPVLYLLHGYSGNHRDWIEKSPLAEEVSKRQWVVVLPEGDYSSWYLDSPVNPQSQFASYLVRDLPEDVEENFPVRRDRSGRAIAGLSMGGHGAMLNALRLPERYGSASSMSGILDLRPRKDRWNIRLVLDITNPQQVLENSVVGKIMEKAENPEALWPALLFDCGTSDTAALVTNRRAQEVLTIRGIHHKYSEHPGAHNWKYWSSRLPEHLDFHEKVRAGLDGEGPEIPAGKRPPERWRDLYTTRTLGYERENLERWIPLAADPTTPQTSRPIVLLGSSTFEISDVRSLLPGYEVAYRGISADRLGLGERGLLQRLFSSVIDLKPRAVFVLNGTNDLGSLSEKNGPKMDDLIRVYGEILDRIAKELPDTQIYAVSLSPLRDNYMRLVPKVEPFNRGIEELAAQRSQVRYLDQWSGLHDGSGVLRPEFSRDGLHLNRAGYDHLGRVMREALLQDGILPQ
jgi:S-formylglutathione hydrolase FrmB/lysophospholipase L1-like esterase